MTIVTPTWPVIVVLIAGSVPATVQPAAAQSAGSTIEAGPPSPPAGRPPAGTIIQPGQGGVGGTGLGKVPADDDAGKGLSVKGAPGQGIPGDAGKTR